MKRLLTLLGVVILTLGIQAVVMAEDTVEVMAENVTGEVEDEHKPFIDGKLGTFLLLDAIDWGQTLYIADHPEYYEINPILGRHPSRGEVNRYFAAGMITTTLIYKLLPEKYADLYIKGMIALEVCMVGNNYRVGIHCRF